MPFGLLVQYDVHRSTTPAASATFTTPSNHTNSMDGALETKSWGAESQFRFRLNDQSQIYVTQ